MTALQYRYFGVLGKPPPAGIGSIRNSEAEKGPMYMRLEPNTPVLPRQF
jgi:hypothetical protein